VAFCIFVNVNKKYHKTIQVNYQAFSLSGYGPWLKLQFEIFCLRKCHALCFKVFIVFIQNAIQNFHQIKLLSKDSCAPNLEANCNFMQCMVHMHDSIDL